MWIRSDFSDDQGHFLWIMADPVSSYSAFDIHIGWKVVRELRIEPPTQVENMRFGGATTLIVVLGEAKAVISWDNRSGKPENRVFPPLKMMF
jgi:hypothetical protein